MINEIYENLNEASKLPRLTTLIDYSAIPKEIQAIEAFIKSVGGVVEVFSGARGKGEPHKVIARFKKDTVANASKAILSARKKDFPKIIGVEDYEGTVWEDEEEEWDSYDGPQHDEYD